MSDGGTGPGGSSGGGGSGCCLGFGGGGSPCFLSDFGLGKASENLEIVSFETAPWSISKIN